MFKRGEDYDDDATMTGVGFIRVKLLQCEKSESSGPGSAPGETFDPYVAINVKEAVNTPGM